MSETSAKEQARKHLSGRVVVHRRKRPQLRMKGIVRYFVSGSMKKSEKTRVKVGDVIEIIEVGMPVDELDALQASLDISGEKLAEMVGISKATLHRHKGTGGILELVTADRVVRYAQLMGKAAQVFGDEEDARKWLKSPQFGLGGAIPLDYAKTELGAREVENLLGRIEYGVYS